MGTVHEFPADAGARRSASRTATTQEAMGSVVILPVIRIERYADASDGDRGPDEGAAAGRRRRRRARS